MYIARNLISTFAAAAIASSAAVALSPTASADPAPPAPIPAQQVPGLPALTELSATILLYTGGTETIAVAIFRLNDLGQLEVVSALSIFTIAIILLVSLVLRRLVGGKLPVRLS